MISYEKIDGYNNKKEGIKCMICNHYYFKDKFGYQPYVCNKCLVFFCDCNGFKWFFLFQILKIMIIEYILLTLIKKN